LVVLPRLKRLELMKVVGKYLQELRRLRHLKELSMQNSNVHADQLSQTEGVEDLSFVGGRIISLAPFMALAPSSSD
jgi:hypothetical protein